MKKLLIALIWIVSSCTSVGQRKIESFPDLSNFIDPDYLQVDNIFPIAIVSMDIEGNSHRIPISYSLFNPSIDSSNFLVKGDFIDNYSFKILQNAKFKPMVSKEGLLLPKDWKPYLIKTREKADSMKSKIDLNNYIKFLDEPNWWQNDATPNNEKGQPMKFICQLELGDFIDDDCCVYIFYDVKSKLVKQIYQRD